jgi:hypothetical protein
MRERVNGESVLEGEGGSREGMLAVRVLKCW